MTSTTPAAPGSSPTLVVGTGLIGTSIGLALTAAGRQVLLVDRDREALDAACARGAGRSWDQRESPAHVVLAVPPRAVRGELESLASLDLRPTVMDVCSIKSLARLQIESLSAPVMQRYAGTHPMAGNAGSGPSAAAGDLFVGRAWALCPHPDSSAGAVHAARDVIEACGAMVVECDPEEHDRAVAQVSHLPQVLASALAADLGGASELALQLAGPALQGMTRVAASPAALWRDILTLNREPLRDQVSRLSDRLGQLAAALGAEQPHSSGVEAEPVAALLEAGRRGIARLPGKHTGPAERGELVVTLLPDEPGALARLLADAAAARVNVEDLRIEHVPGAPLGAVELTVATGAGEPLRAALQRAGWSSRLAPDAGR